MAVINVGSPLRDTAQKDNQGEWDFEAIFNRELYPALKAVRVAVQNLTVLYQTIQDEGVPLPPQLAFNFIGERITAVDDPANNRTNITIADIEVQEEGVALPQRSAINFIGSEVAAVDNPGNDSTDVTITPSGFSYILEWGGGDLGNSVATNLVMRAWTDGQNAPWLGDTRNNEGRGQRYILVPGTLIKMIGAIRGVQPSATDVIWTYTVRVNETATAVTDNFNIRTSGPRQKITSGFELHVNEGDRISISTITSAAISTVTAPYVALLFVPDLPV